MMLQHLGEHDAANRVSDARDIHEEEWLIDAACVCAWMSVCASWVVDAAVRVCSMCSHVVQVERAVCAIIAEGVHVTGDLGGKATTTQMTEAIIKRL